MKRWYIVHIISGREDEVVEKIKKKIHDAKLNRSFGKILIPTEDIIEIRFGKREKSKRKFFPGYILIEMLMNYKTWVLVKYTTNVIGFVGVNAANPIPVNSKDIEIIMERMKESSAKPKPKTMFNIGEIVRVIDGPFADFSGTVEEVNYDKNRLCITVLIFGRSIPIDLNFNQIEKI